MKRCVVYILIFAGLFLPAAVFAESAEQAYQKARDAYHALQNSSRKQMYREQWERVFNQFDAVNQRFPKSDRGADALYMCGKTTAGLYAVSRIKPDAERAVDLYESVANLYPENSLADDALLQAGMLLEGALSNKASAYLVYERLVNSLPMVIWRTKPGPGWMLCRPLPRRRKKRRHSHPLSPAASEVPPGDGRLTAIRYWSNPGYTRIVLDVSSEARFSAHYLVPDPNEGNHPRLYVDIEKTGLDESLKEPTIVGDGLLRQIRTGLPQSDTVRVVLDLDSLGDYKVFPLVDPWRIVIDIAGDKTAPDLKRHETEISALPESGSDAIANVLKDAPRTQPPLHIPSVSSITTLRRIVVDAGHGGKDPGAVGPSGVLEKDVTLEMAKELAKALTKQLGCEVILTRSTDVYLPLEERTAIANKVGADLFVSLHANANKNRKAYGIETYYLNFSKNDKAAAVAARENGTSLKQVSDLELILFDLMANAKINESSRLATVIQENLVQHISKKYSDVRDLGVRQGPFYVLLGATMPSVLVETAFISHPREEKRLTSSAYQKSAAHAIALAIKEYAVKSNLIATR